MRNHLRSLVPSISLAHHHEVTCYLGQTATGEANFGSFHSCVSHLSCSTTIITFILSASKKKTNSGQYWDVATDALDLDNRLLCKTPQNSNDLSRSRSAERLRGGYSEVHHVYSEGVVWRPSCCFAQQHVWRGKPGIYVGRHAEFCSRSVMSTVSTDQVGDARTFTGGGSFQCALTSSYRMGNEPSSVGALQAHAG